MAGITGTELDLEVLPPEEWMPGRKVRVWFRGQEVHDLRTETRCRKAAEAHAEQERAEKAVALAEKERARAARLAEHLRALGIDPETV